MAADDAACHNPDIHAPEAMTERQLAIHLVLHRLQGLVCGERWPTVESIRLEQVSVSSHCRHGAESALDDVHSIDDVLWVGARECRFVESSIVVPRCVDIQSLLVDLRWIEARGQDQRSIHQPSTVGW